MGYKEYQESKYTVKIYDTGDKRWYVNGRLHREEGPAVEWYDGAKGWYINGELHRVNGPAFEYASGTKYWYVNGKLHREDGPAVEGANGSKEWWIKGKKYTKEVYCSIIWDKLPRESKLDYIYGL